MKIVWVDAMDSNVVELDDPELVTDYLEKSATLLLWTEKLDRPLLVLGLAGNHAVTYCALAQKFPFSDVKFEDLSGAGTIHKGEITGWESISFDNVSTSEYWQTVVSMALQGQTLAASA